MLAADDGTLQTAKLLYLVVLVLCQTLPVGQLRRSIVFAAVWKQSLVLLRVAVLNAAVVFG